MNRRQFLVATTASSIAFASRAVEPDRKWRVVVLGDSSRGKYGHSLDSMWLKVPETEVVAVADANAKGLEATLKKLGVARGFADYRDIAQMKPDLVAIGPSMGLHRDMALAAAESGARGIYLEKPFCRTLAEADEIIAACERRGVKLALAHRNRQHPTHAVVERMFKEGAIAACSNCADAAKKTGAVASKICGSSDRMCSISPFTSPASRSHAPRW